MAGYELGAFTGGFLAYLGFLFFVWAPVLGELLRRSRSLDARAVNREDLDPTKPIARVPHRRARGVDARSGPSAPVSPMPPAEP